MTNSRTWFSMERFPTPEHSRMAGSFMCQHVYCTQGFLLAYVILPTVNENAIYRTHCTRKKNEANSVNNRLCGLQCTLHVLGSREINVTDMSLVTGGWIKGRESTYRVLCIKISHLLQINRGKVTVCVSDGPKILTRKFYRSGSTLGESFRDIFLYSINIKYIEWTVN